MIVLEHVSMAYQPGEEVLKDISLHIKPGSFHFLAGASGAGKSSLLALISLQHRATSGNIHLLGKNVTWLPRDELPALRRRIGIVMQDYQLLGHMTVAQNVALPLRVAKETPKETERKVKELLEWIGLAEYHDALPRTLSGGQKQRAAIARAVIAKPALLLADEPTGNLDSDLAIQLMRLLEAMNESGTTVVVATHDDGLITRFNYPVLRLKKGMLQ
jgi:cell division transport system ATP-binding protein